MGTLTKTRAKRIRSEYDINGAVVVLTETYTKCSKCHRFFPVQLRSVRGATRNQPQCGHCRGTKTK